MAAVQPSPSPTPAADGYAVSPAYGYSDARAADSHGHAHGDGSAHRYTHTCPDRDAGADGHADPNGYSDSRGGRRRTPVRDSPVARQTTG